MSDLDQLRLDAIYAGLATDAVLTPDGGGPVDIRAIDKTAGVQIGGDDGVSVYSVVPACFVRATALADNGIDRASLDRGTIELNGVLWSIVSSAPRPGMTGEAAGEVRLILAETEATA